MSYSLTPSAARWFVLIPGRAEWLLYKATVTDAVPIRNITAKILAYRYIAIGGIALSVLSGLEYTKVPVAVGIGISAVASCKLHRLTKKFIELVGK